MGWRWSTASMPPNIAFTIRIACGMCPRNPDRLYIRTTAASTASIDRERMDAHRQQHAETRRRHRIPHGCAPARADTAWVFPMDGTTVWPRTSPDGKPSVRHPQRRQDVEAADNGMPKNQAWWTVKRQAMTADGGPLGLYFGTTSGEIGDQPRRRRIAGAASRGTCRIYAVEAARKPALGRHAKVLIPTRSCPTRKQREVEAHRATLRAMLPTSTANTPACDSG